MFVAHQAETRDGLNEVDHNHCDDLHRIGNNVSPNILVIVVVVLLIFNVLQLEQNPKQEKEKAKVCESEVGNKASAMATSALKLAFAV
jgi:hypothetical protein